MRSLPYVINTINIGGVQAYKSDLEIPDKYGVHQCIGDIIGPGGMFRFLRAYPEIISICLDMEELCLDAFFFNYTNPMAPLCLALNQTTNIKVFGLCHNVQSTSRQLADYHPCYVGDLPYQLAALNLTNINMHMGMAKAAIEKKKQMIYDAVKMDPLTAALLTLDQIHSMVTEMIEANADYLSDFH